jgi:hypothetical protein
MAELEKSNLISEAYGDYQSPMFTLDESMDNYYYANDPQDFDEFIELLDSDSAEPDFSLEEDLDTEVESLFGDMAEEPAYTQEEVSLELDDPDLEIFEDTEKEAPQSNSAFDDLMMEDEGLLPGAKVILFQKEEEEPERETTWEDDSDHGKFVEYMANKLRSIPPHSGQTTVGCEKAISYLRKLDKEISKAIQSDESNVIEEEQAEVLRDKIHDYIDALEAAFDELVTTKRKKKKKASFSVGKKVVARINNGKDLQYFVSVASDDGEERLLKVEVEEPTSEQVQAFLIGEKDGLTKEAGQLSVFIDPFLQSVTRLLIQSHIRQGKNMQDVYKQLHAQYDFTPREQLSIHELLLQKGMPLNVDLGRLQEESPSPMDGQNVEYDTEFYA